MIRKRAKCLIIAYDDEFLCFGGLLRTVACNADAVEIDACLQAAAVAGCQVPINGIGSRGAHIAGLVIPHGTAEQVVNSDIYIDVAARTVVADNESGVGRCGIVGHAYTVDVGLQTFHHGEI